MAEAPDLKSVQYGFESHRHYKRKDGSICLTQDGENAAISIFMRAFTVFLIELCVGTHLILKK